MRTRLIIDGNAVYEIDEDCVDCQKQKNRFQGRMKQQEMEGCRDRKEEGSEEATEETTEKK